MRSIGVAALASLATLALGCGKGPDRGGAADAGTILTARTLGLAYIEENRLEEAEEQFVKLIRLAPDEPSGHANLGLVYLRLGRYPDAARAIDRAVALAPEDPDIRLLQATVLRLTGRTADARRVLESVLETSPAHLKTLYALAEADSGPRRRAHLARLVEAAPANVPARLGFATALLDAGATAEAREQLELLRQRLPELPREAERFYSASVADLQGNRPAAARADLARAQGFLETTPIYQAGMVELRGPEGAPPGYPVLTLSTRLALEQRDPQAVVNAMRFTEVAASTLADSQLTMTGRFPELVSGNRALVTHAGPIAVGDYDNDGHLDVYAAGALFHNGGDGTFTHAVSLDAAEASTALFADLDHDGDLDLFVGTATGDRMYRNNGDGTFRALDLSTGTKTTKAVFGDFDGDARTDVIVAREAGLALYRGLEEGRFEAHDLPRGGGGPTVAAGDYDNDGFLDLFAGGALYRNDGAGGFVRGARIGPVLALDAAFFDFDNDGWLDLAVADRNGLVLLHNSGRGRFSDRSALLPTGLAHSGARQLVTFDFDDDGDLDLLVVGLDGRVRVLRNDGGNANQFVKVALVGLREGSGKNNHFGIGSRVELRAKDLYQMRVVDQPVVHFGLGNRLKADVVRVVWTNGVPQSYYYPGGVAAGADRNLLEQQVLKGSCTFLYTWDGTAFRFLTDVTWASALGMPLGIMAGEKTVYGPPQAAREYFRIPGERLKPADGRYRMQLTEELWEVAYVDQLALLAVDHPESVDVFVNERFVPPGTPASGRLEIHQVGERHLPVSATDKRGRDLLPLLRAKDDEYVGGFTPGPYQGITQPHDLILDLGPLRDADDVRLFLQGWLFPTDASINAAIAQSKAVQVLRPSLAVRDAAGAWRTVIEDLSFPAGKDKTMIVDLTGKFLADDHHVRIRTNMEIYWDHAFVAVSRDALQLRVTRLAPVAADLHGRGWSRVFRKGGRYGPQWFDYSQVTRESPWLPIGGRFTRYGDVLPLLGEADDQTVIIASGDEMTLEFPATEAPPLPTGWKRDFLLWSVAWMKDADLHTAAGQTVEPLPFHAMTRYPYGAEERYPDDAAHRRYVAEFNTRTTRP
ncbi:MAG TPA: FG-GAP-like repeat-containing protein [Gemmatimonadales bacterium]|nr:FG-GAP-like repeat-containing protein [Gemmatimonadales bacterium]